jgi:hypothetical protein
MTCVECGDYGLIPYVAMDNPTPDDAITRDDLLFAVCLCEAGRRMRRNRNWAPTVPLWQVWCAREQVNPERVSLVEHVYDAKTLKAAGLVPGVPSIADRSSALLAAGKRTK